MKSYTSIVARACVDRYSAQVAVDAVVSTLSDRSELQSKLPFLFDRELQHR
jgi:hypothetical protein